MRDGTSRRCKNEYSTDGDVSSLTIIRKNGELITTSIDTYFITEIQKYHWQYITAGYVRTTSSQGDILLHRMVCELSGIQIDGMQVDHIDGNPLNNVMSNLRVCSAQENCRNTRNRPIKQRDGIVGVRRDIRCHNSWRAQIYIDKDKHIEKTFRSKQQAIEQRLRWEIEYFGEFAPQIELIKAEYSHLLQGNKEKED